MESKLSNENDLLRQLKILRAEKELLEKHVFVLNECLSVDELKTKISHLEMKKKKLVQLEKVIETLRAEIEPLKYLKSILDNKLVLENQQNEAVSEPCTSLKSTSCKTLQPEITENIHTDSKQKDSFSSQNVCNEHMNSVEVPTSSELFVNNINPDEYMQLLDQYDVVTDQEILNCSEEMNHSKTQCINQEELSTSIKNDTENEIQDKPATVSSTNKDHEGINLQSTQEENVSLKRSIESFGENVVALGSQLHEAASTSLFFLNQKCLDLDSSVEETNDFLNVNDCTKMSFKVNAEDNKKPDNEDFKTSKSEIFNNESVEQVKVTEGGKTPESKNSEITINSFNDMNLNINILRGIYSLGFVNPTALQKQVIEHCVNGRDVIVFAGPDDGKTMMFTIPLLQRIKTYLNECQALVLVPTRDLAVHVQKIIKSVGDFLDVNVCIGGDNVPKKLTVVPHIVIGTPAGVSKMIACNSLLTGFIHTVVINEADKMLAHSCFKLIQEIMEKLIQNKQVTLMTSVKLDYVLDKFMDSLRDPLVIINDKEKKSPVIENLPKQFYLNIQEEWKINALCEINETLKLKKVIIFCNTLDKAQKLCESLQRLGYALSIFHLEMSDHDRQQKLDMFSSDDLQMIITTDPINGCQFQQASWIVNYDLPANPTVYLYRINKCSEHLKAINFINENEEDIKLSIENYHKSYMIQVPLNMIDILQY